MIQAMLFAAGMGTRLKPLTDRIPKALVEVNGKTLLEHNIEKLSAVGADPIVVNVHHFSQQIVDFLQTNPGLNRHVSISDESSKLLDTGGGLKKAQDLFTPHSPILIHNVDILSNVDLLSFAQNMAQAEVLLLVSERKTRRYLLFDDDMRLVGWTHIGTGEVRSPYPHLDLSRCRMLAFAGIHLFSPHLFTRMNTWSDAFPIMDFYLSVCKEVNIRGYIQPDLRLLDVGKLDTLQQAHEFVTTL